MSDPQTTEKWRPGRGEIILMALCLAWAVYVILFGDLYGETQEMFRSWATN